MNWIIIFIVFLLVIIGTIFIYKSQKKMEVTQEQSVEQVVEIDDSIIDKDDPYEIIEPVWWTGNIYESYAVYEDSLRIFSQEQRYVYAITWYISEVNNGGHDQFFFNSTGIVWKDALDGFKVIGAVENSSILQEAVNLLGGNPSFNREERWGQMGDDLEDKLDKLDDRFYNSNSDLDEIIVKYIKENREKFYFKGVVKKPGDTP